MIKQRVTHVKAAARGRVEAASEASLFMTDLSVPRAPARPRSDINPETIFAASAALLQSRPTSSRARSVASGSGLRMPSFAMASRRPTFLGDNPLFVTVAKSASGSTRSDR